MHGLDDLAGVDALEMRAGDAEVAVSELALLRSDGEQPPTHTSGSPEAAYFGAHTGRRPRAMRASSGVCPRSSSWSRGSALQV